MLVGGLSFAWTGIARFTSPREHQPQLVQKVMFELASKGSIRTPVRNLRRLKVPTKPQSALRPGRTWRGTSPHVGMSTSARATQIRALLVPQSQRFSLPSLSAYPRVGPNQGCCMEIWNVTNTENGASIWVLGPGKTMAPPSPPPRRPGRISVKTWVRCSSFTLKTSSLPTSLPLTNLRHGISEVAFFPNWSAPFESFRLVVLLLWGAYGAMWTLHSSKRTDCLTLNSRTPLERKAGKRTSCVITVLRLQASPTENQRRRQAMKD